MKKACSKIIATLLFEFVVTIYNMPPFSTSFVYERTHQHPKSNFKCFTSLFKKKNKQTNPSDKVLATELSELRNSSIGPESRLNQEKSIFAVLEQLESLQITD